MKKRNIEFKLNGETASVTVESNDVLLDVLRGKRTDKVTQYGGDTAAAGTAGRQDFPADAFTAALIPAAATNIWTVLIEPGKMFGYGLRREAEGRRFRVEFDLTKPVEVPPAPWGS